MTLKTVRILRLYIRVVVISGGLLLLVMRLGGCASRKNALVKKHAPKRVGHGSLNNGASWPDGDPQSLRDSVYWHVESTVNLNSYTWMNTRLQHACRTPNSRLGGVAFFLKLMWYLSEMFSCET